jgi:hypothetical protein
VTLADKLVGAEINHATESPTSNISPHTPALSACRQPCRPALTFDIRHGFQKPPLPPRLRPWVAMLPTQVGSLKMLMSRLDANIHLTTRARYLLSRDKYRIQARHHNNNNNNRPPQVDGVSLTCRGGASTVNRQPASPNKQGLEKGARTTHSWTLCASKRAPYLRLRVWLLLLLVLRPRSLTRAFSTPSCE